jgi:pyridoxine 5-phosphate synthase
LRELKPVVDQLHSVGVRVSLFLDPDPEQVQAAKLTGTDRIELYTEPYARAFGTHEQDTQLARFAAAARLAQELGLGVNAGHDLNQQNLGAFLAAVPNVLEVSIGHAVVCEAFDCGLEATLDRYLALVG